MNSARVLVVEDDQELAAAVALELSHAGYEVRVEGDAPAALTASRDWAPDAILLDLGLPSFDGIEVCRRIRTASATPIVILTARDAVEERVSGLDAGADDYLTKPFSLDELMARIRSVLRRSGMGAESEQLRVGELVLDAGARTVTSDRSRIDLTRREFDLLEFFMRHPNRVLGRESIVSEVWGFDFLGGSNVVDVYVRYVRRKLSEAGQDRLIETVRGVGYALRVPP